MLYNLAWTLATNGNEELRDGAEAVKLAQRACKLTDYKSSVALDSLAAAYAETGQFDQAIKTAKLALKLAAESQQEKFAGQIAVRLELYQQKIPYHQSTPARVNPQPGQ